MKNESDVKGLHGCGKDQSWANYCIWPNTAANQKKEEEKKFTRQGILNTL